MHLEILSPGKKVFEGDILLIKVPGSDGAFEILENHAPIISTLQAGQVKVITTGEHKLYYEIKGGVVEVLKNKVILLSESIKEG